MTRTEYIENEKQTSRTHNDGLCEPVHGHYYYQPNEKYSIRYMGKNIHMLLISCSNKMEYDYFEMIIMCYQHAFEWPFQLFHLI